MQKKRYSLRKRLIGYNLALMISAGVLCGLLFTVSVVLIVGSYVESEVEILMTETAESMVQGISYCSDVVTKIRKSDMLMAYLVTPKEQVEENERMKQEFEKQVSISTQHISESGDLPLVENIYLFDLEGHYLSSSYYAVSYVETEKSNFIFEEIYKKHQNQISGVRDYGYYPLDAESLCLVFPVLDEQMGKAGYLMYQMKFPAMRYMMQDIMKYEEAFWSLCDREGNYICGENTENFIIHKEALFKKFGNNLLEMELAGRDYQIYRRSIGLNLELFAGLPKNQFFLLIYDSLKMYAAAIVLIAVAACVTLVFLIYRMTRPVEAMEIKFLQTQMNPHFMFNVLNTIALQAKMDGNQEVYQMISSFSQLIQAKIYREKSEKVKIRQELEYVNYYLYLQKYRYGDRMQYKIHIQEDGLLEYYVPKLCIQLIVENAVVHGIEPNIGKGLVTVNIYKEGEFLCIDTEDNGIGFAQEGELMLPFLQQKADKNHNRVGLNNAHSMIRLMYGEKYGIRVFSKPGEGSKVCIRVPFDDGKKEKS